MESKVAVFLDRDGVINKKIDKKYITHWSQFEFNDGIFNLVREINELGYLTIVVTNQAGVGLRKMSQQDLIDIHHKMLKEFVRQGCTIDAIYSCTHSPAELCSCRKPKSGMLINAIERFDLIRQNCWMIGDQLTDIEAGNRIKTYTVLVNKNKFSPKNINTPSFQVDTVSKAIPILRKF